MPENDHNNQYDFHCNNDARFVSIAINSEFFHTINIEAPSAVTIDFTGGTKSVNAIQLRKCNKLSSIVWPEETGAIKTLQICYAEDLADLDLSTLINLEELSIINCPHLTTISNLPTTLKRINAHGVNIKTIDVDKCEHLERINIQTYSDQFHLNANNIKTLNAVSIITNTEMRDDNALVICEINHCIALHLINIVSGNIPSAITINQCPTLITGIISSGAGSTVSGLDACSNLDFFYSENINHINMSEIDYKKIASLEPSFTKYSPSLTAKDKLNDINELLTDFRESVLHPTPGPDDDETIIQKYSAARERSRNKIITITLLSAPIDTTSLSGRDDLNKRTTITTTESLKAYLKSRKSYLYYLESPATNDELKPLLASAITASTEASIIKWLENDHNKQPNILLLNSNNVSFSAVMRFLMGYNSKKRVLIYRNKYYRTTPAHKIIAELSARPLIEQIIASKQMPLAAAQRQQFIHLLMSAHKYIHQHSPSVASQIIHASRLHSLARGYLAAVDAFVQTRKALPSNKISPANDSTFSTNSNIEDHSTDNCSQQITQSDSMNMHGQITPDSTTADEQPSKRVKAETSKHNLAASETDNLHDDLWRSLLAERNIHHIQKTDIRAQSANIDISKESDIVLPSARAETNSSSKNSDQDTNDAQSMTQKSHQPASQPMSHQLVFENLPRPQHAKLSGETNDTEKPLSSAKIYSVHEASINQSSEENTTSKSNAKHELLSSAKNLASALKDMTEIAQKYLADNSEPDDSLDYTLDIIDQTISALNAAATSSTEAEGTNHDCTQAVKNLNFAVNNLHHQCHRLKAASSNTKYSSGFLHQNNAASHAASDLSDRESLITMLVKLRDKFIQENRSKNKSESLFGTGFNAGINNMRLQILESFIASLHNHTTLAEKEVHHSLQELCKDKDLAKAVTAQHDDLYHYLTGIKPSSKNK